jgi:UDP:flavonoid glycosyltransferase YjiC (YdhE family)
MRVLFTLFPGTGHVHPLVPFARALQTAGHDVAFASAAGIAPLVEASQLRFFPAGIDLDEYIAIVA